MPLERSDGGVRWCLEMPPEPLGLGVWPGLMVVMGG